MFTTKMHQQPIPFECAVFSCNSNNKMNRIGRPYCPRHLDQLLGLRIAPSTIRGAGLGVFATRDFADRNMRVCDYYSERISAEEYNRRYQNNVLARYVLDLLQAKQHRCFIDGSRERGVDMMFNHGRYGQTANVRFGVRGILTLRPIQAGEELLADYGDAYFSATTNSAVDENHPP